MEATQEMAGYSHLIFVYIFQLVFVLKNRVLTDVGKQKNDDQKSFFSQIQRDWGVILPTFKT